MLTALLITNIALAGMLVHTQKKIKGIAKEIDDIGSNLAYIQSNTVEIGTNINEVKSALESKIETSKDEIKNTSVKLTEVTSNQINEALQKLDNIENNSITISEEVIKRQIEVKEQIQKSQEALIENNKEDLAKFLVKLTFTPIKIMDVSKK